MKVLPVLVVSLLVVSLAFSQPVLQIPKPRPWLDKLKLGIAGFLDKIGVDSAARNIRKSVFVQHSLGAYACYQKITELKQQGYSDEQIIAMLPDCKYFIQKYEEESVDVDFTVSCSNDAACAQVMHSVNVMKAGAVTVVTKVVNKAVVVEHTVKKEAGKKAEVTHTVTPVSQGLCTNFIVAKQACEDYCKQYSASGYIFCDPLQQHCVDTQMSVGTRTVEAKGCEGWYRGYEDELGEGSYCWANGWQCVCVGSRVSCPVKQPSGGITIGSSAK